MIEKKLIRKEVFARRKAAMLEEIDTWSQIIASKVFNTELYKQFFCKYRV